MSVRRTAAFAPHGMIAGLVLLCPVLVSCKQPTAAEQVPQPDHSVTLASYGLPGVYTRFDDDPCSNHVIGYRFVVWLRSDRVVTGFNTSPNCRSAANQRVASGMLRLLALNAHGDVVGKRDLPYAADGGPEIVAPGEATAGPEGTLLLRIEEAQGAKSGVRLIDADLRDVGQIDRFMESSSPIDHSLVFQQGVVWTGPRTYDVYDGLPPRVVRRVTQDKPAGTMDSRVSERGAAYAQCQQELKPAQYASTNVIYSGAHRRCAVHVKDQDGGSWTAPLEQDQVVQILGFPAEGQVSGIVRKGQEANRLMLWSKAEPRQELPWFPQGYDSELESVAVGMTRYLGVGTRDRTCAIAGFFCEELGGARLMIFDRNRDRPLVDRALSSHARAGLAPDGLHYATFESGEVRIYALPARGAR